MTRLAVNRLTSLVPIILSALAMALALGSIATGTGHSADEDWQAHVWQLLMAAQLPIIAAFALTADWSHPSRPLKIIALHAAAIGAAVAPVAIAGW